MANQQPQEDVPHRVGCLTSGHDIPRRSRVRAQRYPAKVHRKVLDLVAAGRPVAQIANDLNISDQTIYDGRRQGLIDTGQLPGLNRAELSEFGAANKRIRELETEVAILKTARELLRSRTTQKEVRGH